MRKDTLKRYVVFRIKAIEFLDLGALWQGLKRKEFAPLPVGRTQDDFAWSIRTVVLSWFSLLIDKNGMDVIELWKELFPKHKAQIEQVWSEIKPTWLVLKTFRDRAGFHADKPMRFFEARGGVIMQVKDVGAAVEKFEQLFKVLLKLESVEIPDLGSAVDELLDELDKNKVQYEPRDQFKKHYMFS